MKVYSITKDGIARIMRLYNDDSTPQDEIAKWHPDDQAGVTDVREISEADIPDATYKDAWRDDGAALAVDMPAARQIHAARMDSAKRSVMRELMEREALGENVASEKAAVQAVNPAAEVAGPKKPDTLAAKWPAAIERREKAR